MTNLIKTDICKRRTGGRQVTPFVSYLSNLLLSHSTETPGDQAESGQESSTSALATLQSLGSAGGQSGVGCWNDGEGRRNQTTAFTNSEL